MTAPDHSTRSIIDGSSNADTGAGFLSTRAAVTARYVLGDEMARGGMGSIYRANDTNLDLESALNVVQARSPPDPVSAPRYSGYPLTTGHWQPPSIPPVHDLGTLADGRPFLAMKLIKGQTLEELLKARADPSAERGRF